ncbi:MAG: hypothetical protein ACJAUD_002775 [Crocinitomicaceae bacterium]|jgi:hypothetical protein
MVTGYRQRGLLEASSTISPSTMLSRKSKNFYLTGFAEYHFDLNVSLRSDTYFHLFGVEEDAFINNGVRSYFGVFYHLNHDQFSNWDVTLGVQPGITIMSKGNYIGIDPIDELEPSRNVVSPSFALSVGAKFYVWQYFNFFANTSYLNSSMGGLPDGPFNTDEIIFSAGLGFQIQTRRSGVRFK